MITSKEGTVLKSVFNNGTIAIITKIEGLQVWAIHSLDTRVPYLLRNEGWVAVTCLEELSEVEKENYYKCLNEAKSRVTVQYLKSNKSKECTSNRSDGSTASYYQLPKGAKELQDLISHRNMNAQLGEIFRACYRFGMASHSDQLRDAKKIKFYIEAEIKRLEANE